jgi:hypothetical protein
MSVLNELDTIGLENSEKTGERGHRAGPTEPADWLVDPAMLP